MLFTLYTGAPVCLISVSLALCQENAYLIFYMPRHNKHLAYKVFRRNADVQFLSLAKNTITLSKKI